MNLKILDTWFSKFIRLRDSDDNGYLCCISCQKVVHWKKADAGHFVNRKHYALRYNEKNVNGQCRACNRFDEGAGPGYSIGIRKKYGTQIIEILLAMKNSSTKWTQFEINELVKYYKKEVKKLLNEANN